MSEESEAGVCGVHDGQAIASQCGQCGKGICRACMEQFGYFCSVDCLKASRNSIDAEEKAAVGEAKTMMKKAYMLLGVVAVFLLLVAVAIGGWLVWIFFLTPVGKVAWTWDNASDVESMSVIAQQEEKIYVKTSDGIMVLDVASGEVLSQLDNPDVTGLTDLSKTGDGFVGEGATHIIRMDAMGKTIAKIETEGHGGEVEFTDDHSQVLYRSIVQEDGGSIDMTQFDRGDEKQTAEQLRTLYKKRQEILDKALQQMTLYDMGSGQKLWTKRTLRKDSVHHVVFTKDTVTVLFVRTNKDYSTDYVLAGYQRSDGKSLWRWALGEEPLWGPVAVSNCVLLADESRLLALGEDGKVKWTMTYDAEDEPDFFVKEDLLFSVVAGMSTCYDAQSGAFKWRSNLEFGSDDIHLTKKQVIVHGELVSTKEVDVGKMPGFNQAEDVVEDFGLNNMKMDTSVPMLVCMDRESGKSRWQVANVHGRIFCDGERLVLFMDTGETSMLAMFKDSYETVIRQYDLKTGEKMFEKVHQLGLSDPMLAGRYMVGVQYDTKAAAAASKFSPAAADAIEGRKPISSSGVVAIRVK